ncbi:MAG: hypothetical protein JWR01_1024 [Subtercola sp.]|nr:hypothetical protein [Subtercola sp.]
MEPSVDAESLRRYRRKRYLPTVGLLVFVIADMVASISDAPNAAVLPIAIMIIAAAAVLIPFMIQDRRLEKARPEWSIHRCALTVDVDSVARSPLLTRLTGGSLNTGAFNSAKGRAVFTLDVSQNGLLFVPSGYSVKRKARQFSLDCTEIKRVLVARSFLATTCVLRLNDGSEIDMDVRGGRLPLIRALAAAGLPVVQA